MKYNAFSVHLMIGSEDSICLFLCRILNIYRSRLVRVTIVSFGAELKQNIEIAIGARPARSPTEKPSISVFGAMGSIGPGVLELVK